MIISIIDPIQSTWIFSLILAAVLLISIKPRKIGEWFPSSLTTELKGVAILMIVLSHIGYFLVSDTRFLWPLSIAAGVGVNLFLLLSGFGLTASNLQKELKPGQFYKKRLWKLFPPFWLALAVFLAADFFILGKAYSLGYVIKAIFGIITHADLYLDINSPLWYFTFILFYYLLFPLVFSKKRPWLSAIILFIAGETLVRLQPAFLNDVMHLYKVHTIAFPLGVLAAGLIPKLPSAAILERLARGWRAIGYYLVMIGLIVLFIYTAINSGVGGSALTEQMISMITVLAIILIFVMKKAEFRLFSIFGLYSYEIYLWHWPLMYRYNIFYGHMPDWLATILYLALFIGVGWASQKVIGSLNRPKKTA